MTDVVSATYSALIWLDGFWYVLLYIASVWAAGGLLAWYCGRP